MSVCGQTGPTEEDTASEEVGTSARELQKQKPASKVVRVLTVLAYLLSVSLAAILLSVYYVCAWRSPEPPPANHSIVPARYSAYNYNHTKFYNFTGGSDTAVNGTAAPQPANIAVVEPNNSSAMADAGTTATEAQDTMVTQTTPQNTHVTSNDIDVFNETDSIT